MWLCERYLGIYSKKCQYFVLSPRMTSVHIVSQHNSNKWYYTATLNYHKNGTNKHVFQDIMLSHHNKNF